jgi:predicted Fe-S protein YdhL (DUF1289 family)
MTEPGPAAPVASPCTGVCRFDEATGLCIGCGRSLDEIARWTTMDEAQRQRIRERLAGRAADAD